MHTALLAFMDTTTLYLKLWDAIIVFAPVKELFFLSLREKVREALKRDS